MLGVSSAIARVSQIVQSLDAIQAVAGGPDFAAMLGGAATELAAVETGEATAALASSSTSPSSAVALPSFLEPGLVERAIAEAESVLGSPYVFGAEGPTAFDCSGLVYWAFRAAGRQIPRSTADGYMDAATPVSRDALQPGDLVFFNYGRLAAGQADHVGIYVGDGKVIEASSSAGGVVIRPVNWSAFIGAGRLV